MEDDLELSAVWGSSLPVSSQVLKFQAMLFEEMGDNLEDISDVEIQIAGHLSSVRTKITRGARVISDEEGSCSVPVWITSTGLLFDRSAQMLQEGNDWCSL